MNDDLNFETTIIEAIQKGRKIEAIKLLRESRNLGLKEAKELVELYCLKNNIVSASSSGGPFSGLLFIILVAGASYLYFSYYS